MDFRDTTPQATPYADGYILKTESNAVYVEGSDAQKIATLISNLPALWQVITQIKTDVDAIIAEAISRHGGGALGQAGARTEMAEVFQRQTLLANIVQHLS